LIGAEPDMELVAGAASGREALAKLGANDRTYAVTIGPALEFHHARHPLA
jgi:hypothetical protein